ncbi:MAG: hypothetical protein J5506_07820 [Prevotella sp.]|nr:hypothetical protein [Prevotella sp.]
MDKKEILMEFFQDKGYDLKELCGFSDNVVVIKKALKKHDALKVLDLYYELAIPVLGGDVLYLKDSGLLDFTYDNWSTDYLKTESDYLYLKSSIEASKDYINNYHHPLIEETSILFDIVPKDSHELLISTKK